MHFSCALALRLYTICGNCFTRRRNVEPRPDVVMSMAGPFPKCWLASETNRNVNSANETGKHGLVRGGQNHRNSSASHHHHHSGKHLCARGAHQFLGKFAFRAYLADGEPNAHFASFQQYIVRNAERFIVSEMRAGICGISGTNRRCMMVLHSIRATRTTVGCISRTRRARTLIKKEFLVESRMACGYTRCTY